MPSPASQWKTTRKRSSQATSKGRAVCGDKPQARFGEGGTGDPVMGDRPLLYYLSNEVTLNRTRYLRVFCDEAEFPRNCRQESDMSKIACEADSHTIVFL